MAWNAARAWVTGDERFVGRLNELQRVEELVVGPTAVAVISGPRGIGKSSLASYVCQRLRGTFEAGGFVFPMHDADFATQVVREFRRRDDAAIAILEDADTIDGGARASGVREIQQALPHTGVIITTRAPEKLPDEFRANHVPLLLMSLEDVLELSRSFGDVNGTSLYERFRGHSSPDPAWSGV